MNRNACFLLFVVFMLPTLNVAAEQMIAVEEKPVKMTAGDGYPPISDFVPGGPVPVVRTAQRYDESSKTTVTDDNRIQFYDLNTGGLLREHKCGRTCSAKLAPDGSALVAMDGDYNATVAVRFFNPLTGAVFASENLSYGSHKGYDFLPNGVVCAWEIGFSSKLLDSKTGRSFASCSDCDVSISPDRKRIAFIPARASNCDDAVPMMMHNDAAGVMAGGNLDEYGLGLCVQSVSDSKAGNWYLTLSKDDSPKGGVFSPDGRYLAYVTDTALSVWNAAMKGAKLTLARKENVSGKPLFSPDSSMLAVYGRDLVLLRSRDWKVSAEFPGEVNRVVFSPDSCFLAAEGADHRIRVYSTKTGKLAASFEGRDFWFSSNGRVAAVRYSGHGTDVFDVSSWSKLLNVTGFIGFALDGSRVVESSSGELKVWRIGYMRGMLKEHLEREVAQWQKKGEYEKTADYLARVNEASRAEYIKKIQAEYIARSARSLTLMVKSAVYDPDNETFKLEFAEKFAPVFLKVPPSDAKPFKNMADEGRLKLHDMVWALDKDFNFVLFRMVVDGWGASYTYDAGNQAAFNVVDLKLNFPAPEIAAPQYGATARAAETRTTVAVGEPELEKPPFSMKADPDKFALVIGIENYRSAPPAKYAERDAATMRSYMRAMGVPDRNIYFLTGANATKSAITGRLDELLPKTLNKKSSLFVYYSGHGSPDEKGHGYIIPWDGELNMLASTAIPIRQFYAGLKALPAGRIVVALDACFSGSGARSAIAEGSRPLVLVKNDSDSLPANMAVLSSATGNEVSGAQDSAGHGLFTYYLLQPPAAKGKSGGASVSDVFKGVSESVSDEAHRQNREQTPQLKGNAALSAF